MRGAGVSDQDLESLLDIVDPAGIIKRNWKFDDVKDWINTFSGGTKDSINSVNLVKDKNKELLWQDCSITSPYLLF